MIVTRKSNRIVVSTSSRNKTISRLQTLRKIIVFLKRKIIGFIRRITCSMEYLRRLTCRRTTGTLWSEAIPSVRTCRTLGRQSTILSNTAAHRPNRSRTITATIRPPGWLRDSKCVHLSGQTRLRTN